MKSAARVWAHICISSKKAWSLFQFPGIRHFPKFRHSNFSFKHSVSVLCMWPPCCIFVNREPRWQQCSNAMADRAKQHNDDLEDRAIGAAGNYGFYAKWAHEGGGSRGVEGALCYRLPKHRFGLTRRAAGRSRRSEVSKRLRGGGDEAGELSGVRPQVDGKGKTLRHPAI